MISRYIFVFLFAVFGFVHSLPGGWGHVHHEHHLIHAPLHVVPEIVHVHEVIKVHKPIHILKKVVVHDEHHHDHHYHEDEHHDHGWAPSGWW